MTEPSLNSPRPEPTTESAADPGVSYEPAGETSGVEAVSAPQPAIEAAPTEQSRAARRRVTLPIVLFVLTCLSTFLTGVTNWMPILLDPLVGGLPTSLAHVVAANWKQGLIYTACVLAILMAHEMGHFVMTVVYGIRASLPYFIPLPISPIGTMGAVIGMDGLKANRREIFDIGLAGPLAGLIVAVPIIWLGVLQLDLDGAMPDGPALDLPLVLRLLVDRVHPGAYHAEIGVPLSRVNPYFMAGWVGLLVTGLNMLPVSQLDGGHVTYALFGRWAHWLARGLMVAVFVYMGVMLVFYQQQPTWILMAVLVLMIGTDHPPTRDDSVKLGWARVALGLASLAIPVLCFIPRPIF